MLVAFTTIELTDEHREAYLALMREHAKTVNETDRGCVQYHTFQQVEDPNRLYVYSLWQDESSFEAHRSSSHNQKWRQDTKDLRSQESLHYYPCVSVYPP